MFWGKPSGYVISKADVRAMEEVAEALRIRFQDLDNEIGKLNQRCALLEAALAHAMKEPHKSLAQKLREKRKS